MITIKLVRMKMLKHPLSLVIIGPLKAFMFSLAASEHGEWIECFVVEIKGETLYCNIWISMEL